MPGYVASDLLGVEAIDAAFLPQSSRTTRSRTRSQTLDSLGDHSCFGTAHNHMVTVSTVYEHCGGLTGVVSDLAAILSDFGGVSNTYMITQVSIELRPEAPPLVTVEGHNHSASGSNWTTTHANNHSGSERSFDVAAAVCIPDQIGSGITMPMNLTTQAISITAAGDVTGATFTVSLEHMDTLGSTGEIFDGQNRTCKVALTLSGVGAVSTLTIGAAWQEDDNEDGDSNQESDTFSVDLYQFVDAK